MVVAWNAAFVETASTMGFLTVFSRARVSAADFLTPQQFIGDVRITSRGRRF